MTETEMTIIGKEFDIRHGGQAYVDIGDIRVSVLQIIANGKYESVIIRSYGPEGDLEYAKQFAAAWNKAIEIAETWQRVIDANNVLADAR